MTMTARTYTEQELAAAVRSTGLGIDTIARLIEEPTTTCYDHYISGIKPGEICPDCAREIELALSAEGSK